VILDNQQQVSRYRTTYIYQLGHIETSHHTRRQHVLAYSFILKKSLGRLLNRSVTCLAVQLGKRAPKLTCWETDGNALQCVRPEYGSLRCERSDWLHPRSS
jgi:hypothetical protein